MGEETNSGADLAWSDPRQLFEPGDMVFHPFAGVGTSVAAAKQQIAANLNLLPYSTSVGNTQAPIDSTGIKRTPMMPDLPSIADTVPGYDYDLFQGLLAPVKTPPAILAKLKIEIDKALNSTAVREQLASSGYETVASSPQSFASDMNAYLEKMREAVKLSGARPEN